MLLIIRDSDLITARSRKRIKGNHGEQVRFVPGDYRIVHVRTGEDGTRSCAYYSMVRLYVQAAILELDKRTKSREGVKRVDMIHSWNRRHLGKWAREVVLDDDHVGAELDDGGRGEN